MSLFNRLLAVFLSIHRLAFAQTSPPQVTFAIPLFLQSLPSPQPSSFITTSRQAEGTMPNVTSLLASLSTYLPREGSGDGFVMGTNTAMHSSGDLTSIPTWTSLSKTNMGAGATYSTTQTFMNVVSTTSNKPSPTSVTPTPKYTDPNDGNVIHSNDAGMVVDAAGYLCLMVFLVAVILVETRWLESLVAMNIPRCGRSEASDHAEVPGRRSVNL